MISSINSEVCAEMTAPVSSNRVPVSKACLLLLAPTGSGKTLAAFLVAIDRIMFHGCDDGDGRIARARRLAHS